MEREVEHVQAEWQVAIDRRHADRRLQADERRAEREASDRRQAEQDRPSMFFRQPRDGPLRPFGAPRVEAAERDFYADEGDDDGVESSWRNFPTRSGARDEPAAARPEWEDAWAELSADEPAFEEKPKSLWGEEHGRGGGGARRGEEEPLVLPKRPSFANPFKIRRQSLTKAEKSRRDSVHPMLAHRNRS